MFRELGFTQKQEGQLETYFNSGECSEQIVFDHKRKEVTIPPDISGKATYNFKIYLAISKKIEELGWEYE